MLLASLLPIVATPFLLRPLYGHKFNPPVDHLLDRTGISDQFYVDLLIFRNGALIGVDEGIVAFAEEWLSFAGNYCTISISVSDVHDVKPYVDLLRERYRPCPCRVRLCGLAAGSELGFYPREDKRGNLPGEYHFIKRMREWSAKPRTVEGRSIYPPQESHPTGILSRNQGSWRHLTFYVSICLIGATAYSLVFLLPPDSFGYVIYGGLAVAFLYKVFRHTQIEERAL